MQNVNYAKRKYAKYPSIKTKPMHDIDKENYQVKERKVTKVMRIKAELEGLEIGQFLVKSELVRKYWGVTFKPEDYYFLCRSFDVSFLNAKKLLPERKFKTLKGLITRIS